MKTDFMFTSESVTPGHPDKLCDQVSDTLVDRFLSRDPGARVNAECAISRDIAFIAVNYAAEATVDIGEAVRDVIRDAGYRNETFNADNLSVLTSTTELPARMRMNVDFESIPADELDRIVARNQVTEFGYACRHTPALMPLPIWLARRLCRRLTEIALAAPAELPISPDATVQVGVEFSGRRPVRLHSIVLMVSPSDTSLPAGRALNDRLMELVITPVFENEPLKPDNKTNIVVSEEGPQVGSGNVIHSGLTGRKTAGDTYGEYSRHSESAKSGKDPWRIDRVATYAARHAAKHLVAADLVDECEVTLSYSIGAAKPVSIYVDSYGSGKIDDSELRGRLEREFDFSLGGIVRGFDLCRLPSRRDGAFYRTLAARGQVGLDDGIMPWERLDRLDALTER